MGLVRAAVLMDFPVLAKELGLDVLTQLRSAGLTAAMLEHPDSLVSGDAVVRLLEQSALASGCETVGLRLASMRRLSHFGIVGLLLAHQSTPRHAIRMALQYQRVLNQAVAVLVEDDGGFAVLRQEVVTDVPMPSAQANELLVASILQLIQLLAGPQWRPRSVHFRHARPAKLDLHQRIFRCSCVFEDEFNGLSCRSGDLDVANPSADPILAGYALRFIDEVRDADLASPVAEVKKLIHLLIPTGRASIKQIAQSLGRNPRSLQRDLDQHGASFSALLNDVQRDLVVGYLGNPRLDVGDVAQLLGYARPGSFTRWFASEFGTSPLEWRRSRSD